MFCVVCKSTCASVQGACGVGYVVVARADWLRGEGRGEVPRKRTVIPARTSKGVSGVAACGAGLGDRCVTSAAGCTLVQRHVAGAEAAGVRVPFKSTLAGGLY